MRILKIPNILGLPIWLIIILVLPTDILNAQPIYEPGEPHYKFEGKYFSDQLQRNFADKTEFYGLIVIEKVKKNKYKVTETIVNNNVLEENT